MGSGDGAGSTSSDGSFAELPAAAAAFLSADCTAEMMPLEEYVAPDTASTLEDCDAIMAFGMLGHARKK